MTRPVPDSGPIVAAVDFSPQARHAARRAARLARSQGRDLALLHVLPEAPLAQMRQWLGAASGPELALFDDARQKLSELADALRLDDTVVQPRVVSGAPVNAILEQAVTLASPLLVLGARGTGYLRRLVLGSTAERLLRRSAQPLLVVRQPPHEPYRRVLVAVDFSPWSAHALALAREVAPGASLLLASVFQVPFEEKLRFAGIDEATIAQYRRRGEAETRLRLQALAAQAGLTSSQWDACVLEGDASLRLVEAELERDCDLVVLGKHGVSAAVDLLLGSTTKHVLAEGQADVLISTRQAA
jgi:nucleotide-binding universal stress UspA family protein